ncbi:MAG: serine/threonine protein kinase [Anaerolineae bacterium]|nr:serine/threonine protein kinase [Anaerolineae bacterium]
MSKRFGPYQVQEAVGKGPLGAVYRAVRDSDGRSVALKILHSDICNQPEILKRFEAEIPAITRLGYAHIHRINQYGVLNQRAYLESDYRAAGSLGARLRTSTQQNTQQSIRLLRHMADALNFAHRQGIHHHGLTLENVLLNERADAVVADFGLRRIVGLRQVLAAGDVPYTVAPEQIRGGSPDHRADLYAMGVIAYALLVGRWPFYGDQATLLKAHLQENVPPPSRVNVHLPPALDAVLLKALAKRPDERYASADILVEALARVLPEPLLITIRLWEVDSAPADLSTHPRSTSELRSLAKTADDFYHLAQAARRENDAIAYLKRALELDPYHTDANRLLFKLEGARPQVTPDKAFQTPPKPAAAPSPAESPAATPEILELKKPRTKRRRSGWTYVGIFGFVMFGLTGVLLVTYITGGSLAPLEILLTGKQPVNEIDGTPIRDIPGAVLTLEPQQSHDLSTDGTSGDTLSAGYVHEYVFTVNSGREVYVYVQFLSTAAANVGPHVAVLLPDGSDITPECQSSEILQGGSGIAYICPVNQSGQWKVRIIGVDGESTGAYVVSASQG